MRVAVIQGGPSSEAEVSRASARCVEAALREAGHHTERLELEAELPRALEDFVPEVAFPAVHGTQGEDGCLQGLLEVLRIPYVGSDVRGSALAADKIASKIFFREAGLLVPRDRILSVRDGEVDLGRLLASLRLELGAGLIVKPAHGGSTLGISRILEDDDKEVLGRALVSAFRHDSQILVEELLVGQEFTCSVLEEESLPRATPVTLIESQAADWYDFESKYKPGGSVHQCPASIDLELSLQIQQASLEAHRALALRDLSRADFIVNSQQEPVILESNTLPGMTTLSLLPEAVRAGGNSFSELLNLLVEKAKRRGTVSFAGAEPLPGS